ncbi:hypothetical protein [Aquidulcibacter sp.]|uniref:hypothetical protein n=1 Tax=Aquidulcibacter sp. TaxID=2052990 RepID=UPI0028A9DF82|nr:hypothetical protein [Aquidulcibacter sp.]
MPSSVFQRSEVATLRVASLPVLPKVLISILPTRRAIARHSLDSCAPRTGDDFEIGFIHDILSIAWS